MRRSILIVDDDPDVRELMQSVLKEATDAEITVVVSAEEALEVLNKEAMHIQFIDLQLPKMNGLELCRQIRKKHPTSVLIAMTGYASIFQVVEAREAGFDDYYVKPFEVQDIIKATEQAMERLDRWRKGRTT